VTGDEEMSTVKKMRVIQYGVGAMGSNMVRLLEMRPEVEAVGAVDHDPAKIGRDLGEVAGLGRRTGITVSFPADEVLKKVEADVVLLATTAFVDEAFEPILKSVEQGCRVVTICQELFFPVGKNVEKARAIDRKARETGVAVTAVGINPGFIMDIVPIVCSVPCWEIRKVFVRRVVDFSPYGPDEMRHIGAGLTAAKFTEGIRRGVIGHIGLLETTAMVAHCLGLDIDELRQTKAPMVTTKGRKSNFITIPPGNVCGFRQDVIGLRSGEKLLDFRMVGIVSPDPDEDGVELGDYARIDGTPSVDIQIREEISQRGGLGTAGVAVNMIPRVMSAGAGFHTMNTLTLPHIWSGRPAPPPVEKITYC
jgi:4-hydroxy-tetrahydrodipicolinate reductase